MVKRAVEMEGTVTGEHGVGMIKRDYLNHELDEDTVDAMRRVNSCFIAIGAFADSLLAQESVRSPVSIEL
jgi:hypothetical protein